MREIRVQDNTILLFDEEKGDMLYFDGSGWKVNNSAYGEGIVTSDAVVGSAVVGTAIVG